MTYIIRPTSRFQKDVKRIQNRDMMLPHCCPKCKQEILINVRQLCTDYQRDSPTDAEPTIL